MCVTHGGSAPQAIKAAKLRLIALADPAINALAQVVRDKEASQADRIKAANAILDRAGLGPSSKIEHGAEPHVGFLGMVLRGDADVDRSGRYDRRTVDLEDDEDDDG